MSDLASDTEALIQELSIKDFVLIGHSMGGKVAQLIGGRHLVPGLKGIVLIAPAPPTPLELLPDMKEQQLTAYSNVESAKFVARNVLSSSKLSDEIVMMLVDEMQKGNYHAKRAWPEYGMAEDILKEAMSINLPVLVIAGETDRIEPVERLESEVIRNIKDVQMVVIKGKGHLLPLEAPEEVAGYIEKFVDKLAG